MQMLIRVGTLRVELERTGGGLFARFGSRELLLERHRREPTFAWDIEGNRFVKRKPPIVEVEREREEFTTLDVCVFGWRLVCCRMPVPGTRIVAP